MCVSLCCSAVWHDSSAHSHSRLVQCQLQCKHTRCKRKPKLKSKPKTKTIQIHEVQPHLIENRIRNAKPNSNPHSKRKAKHFSLSLSVSVCLSSCHKGITCHKLQQQLATSLHRLPPLLEFQLRQPLDAAKEQPQPSAAKTTVKPLTIECNAMHCAQRTVG